MDYDVCEKMIDSQRAFYQKYKNDFPFKIVEFINDLGVDIYACEMPNEQSGAIIKEGNKYVIYCNKKHPDTRIRFTLAHELGHFFNDRDFLDGELKIEDYDIAPRGRVLHRKKIQPLDLQMRNRDVLANLFAANILMPEGKFKEILRENFLDDVANFFGVSLDAAKLRATVLTGDYF